jgi:hypothetical protein
MADLRGEKLKTYQDLLAIARDDVAKAAFCIQAIQEHRASEMYRIAVDAELYYAKRNVTITKFQKLLYTLQGRSVPDLYSANYKTKSGFFHRMVIQQVQYVLSNGVTFEDKTTKSRLGADFDFQIQKAAKKAVIDGVSFVFANFDHVEVFGLADTSVSPGFVPLYDRDTAQLKSGVRYWYSGDVSNETLHFTLYELDGYTSYIRPHNKDGFVTEPKRGYIKRVSSTQSGGVESIDYSNYADFPIVPMFANDLHESELIGIRESIDCYDYIKNGLANDIDDTSGIYWTLKNSGGMDDIDLARFLERMRVVKAATVDDSDAEVQAHTLDVPTEARTAMLKVLNDDLYRDAMLLDVSALSASSKTATEIRAAYQPQDDKCGDFEYLITECINGILKIFGINDTPSYKWNRIANQSEETQMVLSAAQFLDDETILNHLPWITPEEVESILQRRAEDDLTRLTGGEQEPEEDENEPDE